MRMQHLYELANKVKSSDKSNVDEFVARVSETADTRTQ